MSKLMKKSFSAMLVILLAITLTMTGDIPVANAETIRFDWSLTPHGINEKFSLVVPMKTSKKVTWTSSKKSVAVVNSKGIVTTKKAGKTIITGKVGNKKFEYKIAVAVKLNYEKFFLNIGQTKILKVEGAPKKPTWSSSKKSVATVDKNGKVEAKKAGTTTITAKVGTKKYKCKITVSKTRSRCYAIHIKNKTVGSSADKKKAFRYVITNTGYDTFVPDTTKGTIRDLEEIPYIWCFDCGKCFLDQQTYKDSCEPDINLNATCGHGHTWITYSNVSFTLKDNEEVTFYLNADRIYRIYQVYDSDVETPKYKLSYTINDGKKVATRAFDVKDYEGLDDPFKGDKLTKDVYVEFTNIKK